MTYTPVKVSKPLEPIRWAALGADGSVAREFCGHHAPIVCERWCEDANQASSAGESAPEAVADRLRNARA